MGKVSCFILTFCFKIITDSQEVVKMCRGILDTFYPGFPNGGLLQLKYNTKTRT